MSKSEDEQCKDLLQKIASIAGLINRSKYINNNVAIARNSSSNLSTNPATFSYPYKNTSRKKHFSLVTPVGQVNMSSPIPTINTSYVRRGNKLVRNSGLIKVNKSQTPIKSPITKFTHFPHRKSISTPRSLKPDRKQQRVKASQLDIKTRLVRQSKNLIAKAKKKTKYCIFFNKYGKCNNQEKCPFIHDSSKVAVCRKFLKGECHDDSCTRLHKVAADRMPVCSYFLRGVCTKENCPYSHVRVNPKAQICQQFVNGYCPQGENCKLKHVEVCSQFFHQGICQNGEDCKLLHHKKQTNDKLPQENINKTKEDWIDLNADEDYQQGFPDARQVISDSSNNLFTRSFKLPVE